MSYSRRQTILFRDFIRAAFGNALLVFVLLAGCNKSPYERTKSTGGGGTGTFGSANYVIFSSELISGGGAFEYPGSEGQSLIFSDTSNPVSNRSIRYSWTGEAVSGQTVYAGFDLMHTSTLTEYSSTIGRNLLTTNYSKVTFYARGQLTSYTLAKIEVADDGNTSTANLSCVSLSTGTLDAAGSPCGRTDTLTSGWTRYTIPIASPSTALAAVKDFFKVTFVYNNPIPASTAPGQGGTIYIDQIQYEP